MPLYQLWNIEGLKHKEEREANQKSSLRYMFASNRNIYLSLAVAATAQELAGLPP
jgi:hypothetical protein